MKMQIQQLRQKYTQIKELLNRTGNKVLNHTQNQNSSTGVMYLSIQKLYHSTCTMYLTAFQKFTAVPALHKSATTNSGYFLCPWAQQPSGKHYHIQHLPPTCVKSKSLSSQSQTYLILNKRPEISTSSFCAGCTFMKYLSAHNTPSLKTSAISKYVVYLKNTDPVLFCALAINQNPTIKVVKSNCMNRRRYSQYQQLLTFKLMIQYFSMMHSF
jgi:hypothetical protein